jgi:hypothetical protein
MRQFGLGLLLALSAMAQTKSIEVSASDGWKDSGIDVAAGDLLNFEASGKLKFADSAVEATPEGLKRGWMDLVRAMQLNDAGRGALIGRISDSAAARPFLIGERRETRMVTAGRLFLAVNQPASSAKSEGSYTVKVVIAAKAGEAQQTYTGTLPQLTKEHWAQIPPRVVDAAGTEGDRVNFIILGGEDQVKKALSSMGWVIVDRSVKDSLIRGSLGVLSREAYLTMPMSELLMFGRPQDYGFAHSDPIKTIMARHHFRIWKAPFKAGDWTVWVGAGTHDVGFDRDQRNGKVTHKIDPNTDLERDYIGESLKNSGQVVKLDYYTPEKTIKEAKTAHGQAFTSDGRILLITLAPEAAGLANQYGDMFCSVLAQVNPDTGEWGNCSDWLQGGGKTDLKLELPSRDYRLLIIPGIMNTCVSDTPAWDEGRKHLTEKYGITTEIIPVPNDSAESNAKLIAEYLKEKMAGQDKRKYIVIGYSKGTPDMQEALARYEDARKAVAAFASVAGASGGSPIADSLPMRIGKYMEYSTKASCKGDLAAGMNSLKREARLKFLSAYPHTFVPTYSLAAVASQKNVQAKDKATIMMLNTYDKEHDGQVLRRDAIIPESKVLGVAVSDHLGIALNFEKGKQPRPIFPRAAVLEAILRTVLTDLGAKPAATPPTAAETKPETKPEAAKSPWSQE